MTRRAQYSSNELEAATIADLLADEQTVDLQRIKAVLGQLVYEGERTRHHLSQALEALSIPSKAKRESVQGLIEMERRA